MTRDSAAFRWVQMLIPIVLGLLAIAQAYATRAVRDEVATHKIEESDMSYDVRAALSHALRNMHALCRSHPGECEEDR